MQFWNGHYLTSFSTEIPIQDKIWMGILKLILNLYKAVFYRIQIPLIAHQINIAIQNWRWKTIPKSSIFVNNFLILLNGPQNATSQDFGLLIFSPTFRECTYLPPFPFGMKKQSSYLGYVDLSFLNLIKSKTAHLKRRWRLWWCKFQISNFLFRRLPNKFRVANAYSAVGNKYISVVRGSIRSPFWLQSS